MRFIKRLDLFIAKSFLTLFLGTFSISLFVVLLQFSWRYIDELVGKGLSITVLCQFFWYATLYLVPVALPLAVLLASLISMGNLGEKLELLAIKAAGITLFRTLRPILILSTIISLISFYFQNVVVPEADNKFMLLYYSIKMKSPELDIPEGVFYDGIRGNNIYVQRKDKETGMMYNVIIYNFQNGSSNAHIILADSALLQTSSTKQQLLLHLYNGEQFENTDNDSFQQGRSNVPYRRETFVEKHFIIDFDTNLNMVDNESFNDYAKTKNISQMIVDIDTLKQHYDSVGRVFYKSTRMQFYNIPNTTMSGDSAEAAKALASSTGNGKGKTNVTASAEKIDIDTVFNRLSPQKQQSIVISTLQRVSSAEIHTMIQDTELYQGDWHIRGHWAEIYQKISMSLACLMFFFIGAPLGAIIRKGGLGMPVVASVVIFIFYYIVNTAGVKLGREGNIPVEIGVWLSTMILMPIGIFLTIKSNNDSAVFNMDAYKEFFRKLCGIRQKRNIPIKEVIINDPDYDKAMELIDDLSNDCHSYLRNKKLKSIKYFLKLYIGRADMTDIETINNKLEYLIDMLSNTRKMGVITYINQMPIVDYHSFRYWRRVRNDMRNIIKTGDKLKQVIHGK